jgi:hypothetical protein
MQAIAIDTENAAFDNISRLLLHHPSPQLTFLFSSAWANVTSSMIY